jgi:hypothetical protein
MRLELMAEGCHRFDESNAMLVNRHRKVKKQYVSAPYNYPRIGLLAKKTAADWWKKD